MTTNQSKKEPWIDRAVGFFSPRRAAERKFYRAVAERAELTIGALSGSYVGASRTRRSMSGYLPSYGDADADILDNLDLLRRRSRDLARNNPLASGAINTVATNVIGTGLKMFSRIDREFLGMSDDEADAWESQAEREFRLWAESTECDFLGVSNFYDLQDLAIRQVLRNGDEFVLTPRVERTHFPYSLQLQFVEADRICNENGLPDSDTMAGGIKRDSQGRVVGYCIADKHPGNIYGSRWPKTWKTVNAYGTETGLPNVLHLFKKTRTGQIRGVPYFHAVIEAFKKLGQYTEAELEAAVIGAFFTVFVKTKGGGVPIGPWNPTETSGRTTATTDETLKLGKGTIIGLKTDEDISIANPGRPNATFDPFVLAILKQIGVALELPFEIFIKHFDASYSAARAALLEAWKFFNARRAWIARALCQPVYEMFLFEAVSLGRISAPGFFNDLVVRMAYSGASWIGPGRGMINELQEINAADKRVNMGVSNLQIETAQIAGDNWEIIHRQAVKERRARLADGLIEDKAQQGGK